MPEDVEKHYRVIDFLLVFSTISSLVKCNQCDGSIQFKSCKKEGIAFQIQVKCENCDPRYIPSNEKTGHRYEVNTRFAFAMDIASNFIFKPSYLDMMKSICISVKTTAEKFLTKRRLEKKRG